MYGYETFHEDLMKNLIESVHNGVSSHAYIFEGEKGRGSGPGPYSPSQKAEPFSNPQENAAARA